jgi:pSer/pThr/pTyr-binding forkhead associated (FHA) protein
MLSCPRCGGVNTETGSFCQFCGSALNETTVASSSSAITGAAPCPACAALNPLGTNFCHNCGEHLDTSATMANPQLPDGEAQYAEGGARLVAVRRDGSDGATYDVSGAQFDIGRTEGDLTFDDPHLSARHARIAFRDGQHVIMPLETRNGVYVRIRQPVEMFDGDQFLIGKQVLRFEVPFEVEKNLRPAVEHGVVFFGTPVKPPWGRLRQMTAAGTSRDVFHLTRGEVTLGREQGELVFPDDEFLSRRHAQVTFRSNRVTLADLGSSNGSFVRLRGQHLLTAGELIRIGDELLRFEPDGARGVRG